MTTIAGLLGLGSAGAAAGWAWLRWPLYAATVLLIATAFFFAYRPDARRHNRYIAWMTLLGSSGAFTWTMLK